MTTGRNTHISVQSEVGFTLIELLIVIAIVSITSAIAFPAMKRAQANAQLQSATSDFSAYFQRARLEAVRRSDSVTIAFFQTVAGITHEFVMFEDDDDDSVLDGGEEVILTWDAASTRSMVFYDTSEGGDGVTFSDDNVRFTSRGLTDVGASSPGVYLKNTYGRVNRISLNMVGNVKVEKQ